MTNGELSNKELDFHAGNYELAVFACSSRKYRHRFFYISHRWVMLVNTMFILVLRLNIGFIMTLLLIINRDMY